MNARQFTRDQLPIFLANPTIGSSIGGINPIATVPLLTKFNQGGYFFQNYTYIDSDNGKIRYASILPGHENAISNRFSGCAMAYFKHNNHFYVAHIFLAGIHSTDDCGEEWNTFICNERANIGEYAIFKPTSGKRILKNKQAIDSFVGFITPDLKCYSIAIGAGYTFLKSVERKRRVYISRNLSLESSIYRFLIPDNRTNW